MTAVEQQLQQWSGHIFVNNCWQKSAGECFPVIDPASEKIIAAAADTTDAEIETAIAYAAAAQKIWWQQSATERAEALHQVADKLQKNAAFVGECLTREMGKPYREAHWEGGAAASSFRYYAELARHDNGRVAGPTIAHQWQMTFKEPLGTVVAIVPFNFPLLLFGWQAAAALAAGNAIIIKPSDLTPMSLLAAMRAFDHLPAGLVQVLTGGARVGQRLVEHSRTHAVAFTGSVSAAQHVAQTCARLFKPVLIEASGNDPFIVMPSADVDVAAKGAAFAAFLNCGQVCTSAERFYVHEKIYDQFVAALVREAKALRLGHGLEKIDIGPLAAQRERDRVETIVARARAQGATVLCGGERPSHLSKGWFYLPTVMAVTHDLDIMHGECFGPLAPVCKVASFDQALHYANDSEMGLGANIYTQDLNEMMRAVSEIESGIVWVNTPLNDNDGVPFGGRKLTGMGRELGAEGLEQFRRSKMVMVAPQAEMDEEWFPYPDDDAFAG